MGVTQYVAGDLTSIDMATVLENDALTDTPDSELLPRLDACFPGAKSFLTVARPRRLVAILRKQFNQRFLPSNRGAQEVV